MKHILLTLIKTGLSNKLYKFCFTFNRIRFYRNSFLFYILVSLAFILGCANDDDIPKIIIGEVDWENIVDLPENDAKKNISKYVGYFYAQDYSWGNTYNRCTATLISPSLIITNYHCIVGKKKFNINFNYLSPDDYNSKTDLLNDSWNCDEIVFESSSDDIAILKCDINDNNGKIPFDELQGYVDLDIYNPIDPKINDSVYLIHQNCDYRDYSSCSWDGSPPGEATKKISYGKITDYPIENYSFENPNLPFDANGGFKHSADTLGGTSGSLVFLTDNNKVIGVNHASQPNNNMARSLKSILQNNGDIIKYIEEDIDKTQGSYVCFKTNDNDPLYINTKLENVEFYIDVRYKSQLFKEMVKGTLSNLSDDNCSIACDLNELKKTSCYRLNITEINNNYSTFFLNYARHAGNFKIKDIFSKLYRIGGYRPSTGIFNVNITVKYLYDFNYDSNVDLKDCIIVIQLLSGVKNVSDYVQATKTYFFKDGKIGFDDLIMTLNIISGL